MRDPARIPRILEALRLYWEQNPDLRLGQIIHNAAWPDYAGDNVFFMEDDLLEERLTRTHT